MDKPMLPITLQDFNLETAERRLCVEALTHAGNIVGAAPLLGITRHALKRRIIKLGIAWSRKDGAVISRTDADRSDAYQAGAPAEAAR